MSTLDAISLPNSAMEVVENGEEVKASPSDKAVVTTTPTELSRLEKLKQYQRTLQEYSKSLDNRIYELETIYLEETANGNIVRGWELDGRQGPLHKKSNDEKERLFSFSSYRYLTERKSAMEVVTEKAPSRISTTTGQKQRKGRKRKSNVGNEFEDWNGLEDY